MASVASRSARVFEVVLVIVFLTASALALQRPLSEQKFTVDESRWITTSRYFWITFIDHDLSGPAWQPSYLMPSYLVLTHPPVAPYLIGFGLWLQGWTPKQLNGRFDTFSTRAFNERAGNVPTAALLAAARRVELVFALGALLLLYLTGRTLLDPLTGFLALALAVGNPLLATLWTRALAEAPFAFWSLLALFLALRCVARFKAWHVSAPGCIATGAALGLATATKLSGLLGGAGLACFFGLQQALALWRTHRPAKLRLWLALGAAVVLTFIAVYPLLYRNPIGNTVMLFEFRSEEMDVQRRVWPDNAVTNNLLVRAQLIGKSVFLDYGTVTQAASVQLDVLLFVVGLGATLQMAVRSFKAKGALDQAALFLCWLFAAYVGSTALLGYNVPHYYAPLVQLNVVLEAVALSWAAGQLLDPARRAMLGHSLRLFRPATARQAKSAFES